MLWPDWPSFKKGLPNPMRGMEDMEAPPGREPPMAEETPLTEQGQPDGDGNTISIPIEFVQGTQFKPGDELVLKVVSVEDGELEVEYATEPDKETNNEPPSADDEIDRVAAEGESY